jgi:hypothetical protein
MSQETPLLDHKVWDKITAFWIYTLAESAALCNQQPQAVGLQNYFCS